MVVVSCTQKKALLKPTGFTQTKVCNHYYLLLSLLFLPFPGFFLSLSMAL